MRVTSVPLNCYDDPLPVVGMTSGGLGDGLNAKIKLFVLYCLRFALYLHWFLY